MVMSNVLVVYLINDKAIIPNNVFSSKFTKIILYIEAEKKYAQRTINSQKEMHVHLCNLNENQNTHADISRE